MSVRLRDKIFPEGGKLRSWLRTLNRFVHSIFCKKVILKNKLKA